MTDPDGGVCMMTTAALTAHDRREVVAFKRFLSLGVRPDEYGRIPREFPGWLPYLLGRFFEAGGPGQPMALLAPPQGYDDVPVTAWPVPSHDPPVAWKAGPDYALGKIIDGVCCPAMPEGSVAIGWHRDLMVVLDEEPGRR